VLHNSEESAILSGNHNNILGSMQSFIGSGVKNIIDYSDTASITSGSENLISASNNSGVVNGFKNSIVSSVYSFIGGGSENTLNGVSYSGILGGYDNNIMVDLAAAQTYINDNSTSYVFAYLEVGSGSKYMSIVGGDSNFIDTSYQANVLGGSYNTIIYSADSTILGGANNSILLAQNSSIFGGNINALNDSYISTIVNGENNWIGGSSDCSIVNGDFNYITNSSFSTVLGGIGNNMYNTHHSTILNGSYVRADYTGEVIHNAVTESYPQQPNHSIIMYHMYSDDAIALNTANGIYGTTTTKEFNYITVGINNTASYTTNATGALTVLNGDFIACKNDESYAADLLVDIYIEYNNGTIDIKGNYTVKSLIVIDANAVNTSANSPIYMNINHTHTVSGATTGSVTSIAPPAGLPSTSYAEGVVGAFSNYVVSGGVGDVINFTVSVFEGKFVITPILSLKSTMEPDLYLNTINKLQVTAKFDGIYRKSTS